MGCMMLRECTEDTQRILDFSHLQAYYKDVDFGDCEPEITELLSLLDDVGVEVYLADTKYFVPLHRGVYHTGGNKFFLNSSYMHDPLALMDVLRHEGMHAAQDCMAGTIDNGYLAVIYNDDEVPLQYREMAERIYPENAVPWEQEAKWAGATSGITIRSLEACKTGTPWTILKPTPMTAEWLQMHGYLQ